MLHRDWGDAPLATLGTGAMLLSTLFVGTGVMLLSTLNRTGAMLLSTLFIGTGAMLLSTLIGTGVMLLSLLFGTGAMVLLLLFGYGAMLLLKIFSTSVYQGNLFVVAGIVVAQLCPAELVDPASLQVILQFRLSQLRY